MSPRLLYSRLALAEVVTWTLLIAGMFAKYVFGLEWATMVGGSLHGFAFISYCVVTIAVWIDKQWTPRVGLLGLLSAVIPYCTIPFERWVERQGLLSGTWRLGPQGQSAPATLDTNSTASSRRNPAEVLLSTALHRPALSAVIALLGIAVVFSLLLWAGPPTEW